MAITKFLARDIAIEIEDPSSGGGYTAIGGLNTLTHAPASTDAVTTDFDSAGRAEHMKAERGDVWTLAGFKLEDVLSGDGDPGQLLVEALSHEMGPLSLGAFKLTSPGGNTIDFEASAEVTLPGGGNNDAGTWQAVITVSGPVAFA